MSGSLVIIHDEKLPIPVCRVSFSKNYRKDLYILKQLM